MKKKKSSFTSNTTNTVKRIIGLLKVDEEAALRLQELKSKVKRMLASQDHSTPYEKLDLIDKIQRLGISYHFDEEIKDSLHQIHLKFLPNGSAYDNEYNLHDTALQFRILRQHGFRISSGVFDKFKDHGGSFDAGLINDVRGLLSLYEASHFQVHGEETLDEALNFSIDHLKAVEEKSLQVSHALKQSVHRGVPRLQARRYIEAYYVDESPDEVLLSFAKLDFSLTQKQHQREVAEVARWWDNLDLRRSLPFARDRVVECYFWILGVYFEPEYALARIITTKVLIMISIIDDIYDAYGTIEELEMLTGANERWEIAAMDELPGYMQACYGALLDVYYEVERALSDQRARSYYLYYAKEAMKIIVRAYMEEAKWLHKKHVPKLEEYLDVARVTAGYRSLTITSLIGMPEITTEDTFQWLIGEPKILKASGTACRLMDDIASHKFEQERIHIASAVQCYMKQYEVSEQEAEYELKKLVEGAWKDVNEECFHLTAVPDHVLQRIVNFTRILDVMYKDGDCYTNSSTKLKDIIASLLTCPVQA